MKKSRILAISGSLRQISYNTAAIKALAALAPSHIEVNVFEGIENLPLFNPDRENEVIEAVVMLKKSLQQADALIIASPEYAHGISGVMKNSLDWLVSGEEFINVPVALINTSPRAGIAQKALREVINTMSGRIIEDASISIPLLGSNYNTEAIVADPDISQMLITALHAIHEATIVSTDRWTGPNQP
jgi:chromate reductase, NAD(P)H dehydrogenase (quinone)